jgi:RNA polymerase sigma-70 factor (sigma-E family)
MQPVVGATSDRQRMDRLEEAYVRNAGSAIRFAYLLTGDREMAEDLAQEAFVRVASRLRQVRAMEQLDAYVRTTIVNLFRSTLRRKRLERAYLERERTVGRLTVVQDDAPAERDDMWRALGQLPARQRAAVVLRYHEDLSERDAALVLGCSIRALNSLIVRAMTTLRAELERGEAS